MDTNENAEAGQEPFRYRPPGVVERRRRRCTLPMFVITVSIIELCFYSLVLILFSIGMTVFDYPQLAQDRKISKILRIIIMSFAGVYVLLAVILLIGTLRKVRTMVLMWVMGALVLMMLEWIAVVISVALVLNGALFFISGGYGPMRLCFICLAAMYSQRLKYGKTANVVPVVEHMEHGHGYQMVTNSSAIFTQPLSGDSSAETLRLNFELNKNPTDQSLV